MFYLSKDLYNFKVPKIQNYLVSAFSFILIIRSLEKKPQKPLLQAYSSVDFANDSFPSVSKLQEQDFAFL